MPVSKRLRYEVLRRDNHACRYCGQMAPDVKITIDHVVPVALGGKDEADNLVACCADCNAGKSSSSPDQPIVADVAQDALRFRAAMLRAEAMALDNDEKRDAFTEMFRVSWERWTYPSSERGENGEVIRTFLPLPNSWRLAVERYIDGGLTEGDIDRAIDAAMGKKYCKDEFAYTLGVLNNIRQERVAVARAFMMADEQHERVPDGP